MQSAEDGCPFEGQTIASGNRMFLVTSQARSDVLILAVCCDLRPAVDCGEVVGCVLSGLCVLCYASDSDERPGDE